MLTRVEWEALEDDVRNARGKTTFLVATVARYVLVDAANEDKARRLGLIALREMFVDEAGPSLVRIDFFNYGEAFLHKRAIEMCEYIKAKFPHIYLYTSTNGLALTQEQARRLVHSGIDEVTFSIDADGILTVSAREEKSGAAASIEVQPMHGLTDGEVETMLADSYAHAREDFERGRIANLEVEIGTILRAIEKNLAGAADQLDRETVEDIRDAAAKARAALGGTDVHAAQAARDELEQASLPLAAVLMDSVAKQALSGKKLSEV